MPQQGMERRQTFTIPERMIKIKCAIHPWMGTWCGVFSHPFYSATEADGSYAIEGVPPGTYTLEVWHEKYVSVSAEVAVTDGETVAQDFTLSERK